MVGSVPVGLICFLLLITEFGIVIVITRKGRHAGGAPLTPMEIFWAVFGALWAFSLSAGLLWSLIGLVAEAFTPIGLTPAP